MAGISYFPVPGVGKKKKLRVPLVTKISTVHLFISNLTRAVWGLPASKIGRIINNNNMRYYGGAAHSCSSFADLVIKTGWEVEANFFLV